MNIVLRLRLPDTLGCRVIMYYLDWQLFWTRGDYGVLYLWNRAQSVCRQWKKISYLSTIRRRVPVCFKPSRPLLGQFDVRRVDLEDSKTVNLMDITFSEYREIELFTSDRGPSELTSLAGILQIPSLRRLELGELPSLQNVEHVGLLHFLTSFTWRRPNAISLLPLVRLTLLSHLDLSDCLDGDHSFLQQISQLHSLKILVISKWKKLESLDALSPLSSSSLEQLDCTSCPRLHTINVLSNFKYLQRLRLCNCPLISLTQINQLTAMPKLNNLFLHYNSQLRGINRKSFPRTKIWMCFPSY